MNLQLTLLLKSFHAIIETCFPGTKILFVACPAPIMPGKAALVTNLQTKDNIIRVLDQVKELVNENEIKPYNHLHSQPK